MGPVRNSGITRRRLLPAETGGGAAPAPVLHAGVHRAVLPGQAQAGTAAQARAGGSAPRRPQARLTGLLAFPQRSLEHNRFGRLSVRCHYEAAEQRLAVEVLHAADLLPLDANGAGERWVGLPPGGEGLAAGCAHSRVPRPKRHLCDRGAGSAAPFPAGPQPEDPGQEPDAAPRVRRALLLVSVPPRPAGRSGEQVSR